MVGLIRGDRGHVNEGATRDKRSPQRSKPRLTIPRHANRSRNEHSLPFVNRSYLNASPISSLPRRIRCSLPRRFIYRCLFFLNAITRNSAICVIARLGRFRRHSAGLGHASNTRSPTWLDQFADLPGRSGGENNRPDLLTLCVCDSTLCRMYVYVRVRYFFSLPRGLRRTGDGEQDEEQGW